jgi:hypothetical protein
MRKFLPVLLSCLVVIALIIFAVVVGLMRSYTAYGTGTGTMNKNVSAVKSLNDQLTGQILSAGYKITQSYAAVSYNTVDKLRGYALCKNPNDGIFAVNTKLRVDSKNISNNSEVFLKIAAAFNGKKINGYIVTATKANAQTGVTLYVKNKATIVGSVTVSPIRENIFSISGGTGSSCFPLNTLPKTSAADVERVMQ